MKKKGGRNILRSLKQNLVVLLICTIFILNSSNLNSINANVLASVEVSDQNPILFVHGWTEDGTVWAPFINYFVQDGWSNSSLFTISFWNSTDCSDSANINNANNISLKVNEILSETHATKIDLIAFSMGGISSRYYVKFLGGLSKVDDYVTIATNHHGDFLKTLKTHCYDHDDPLIEKLNEGDETAGGLLTNDTIGNRTGPFGVNYNGTHVPGNVNYTSIFSLNDGEIPPQSAQLDGAYNINLTDYYPSDGNNHNYLKSDFNVYKLVKSSIFEKTTATSESSIFENNTAISESSSSQVKSSNSPGFSIFMLMGAIYLIVLKKKKFQS